MKSVVADPETRVTCARIETVGGLVFRFAWYPHNLIMSNGEVYITDPFFEPSDVVSEVGLSPSVFDSQAFFDSAGITRNQLLSGVLDNARGYLFETSWAAPVEDEEAIKKTIFGKSRIEDDQYIIESMSLSDPASQSVGTQVSAKCTHTLFDETLDSTTLIATDRSRCTGPRAAPDGPVLADYLVTGTVTGVTSQSVWTDTGRTEDADYFALGSVLWLTGDNSGLRSMSIKDHATGGVFTLQESTFSAIQVGDTYKMIPGCDKKRSGSCVTVYDNAINCVAMEDVVTEEAFNAYGTNGN